jgi:hypothetical protein
MATVNVTLGIQAQAGPQLSISRPIEVHAYDRVAVTVNPGGAAAAEVLVDIQPSGADRIAIFAVQSSLFGKEIVYRLSDGATDSDPVQLDQPQVFIGNAIALFGVAPKTLKIKNTFAAGDATKKALIEVFVARQATS